MPYSGFWEIIFFLLLFYIRGSSAHIILGGARGIGLGIVTAIIEAGGHVAIIDLLPQPHPDCQALREKSENCHYYTYVDPLFGRARQRWALIIQGSGDITKLESLEPAFAKCVSALGGSIDAMSVERPANSI